MKAILMILMIISIVSCGKNNPARQEEQERNLRPDEIGYVDTSHIGETELLNVTAKIGTTLSEDRIIFSSAFSLQEAGLKISCSFSVSDDEVWHFRKSLNGIELDFPDGSRQTLKPVGNNSNLIGSWIWSGTIGDMKIRRRYTFFNNGLVINQDCEQ